MQKELGKHNTKLEKGADVQINIFSVSPSKQAHRGC